MLSDEFIIQWYTKQHYYIIREVPNNLCVVQIETSNTAEEKEEDYEYDYELDPVSVVQGDIIVDDEDDETGRLKSVFTTDPERWEWSESPFLGIFLRISLNKDVSHN